MHGCGIQLIFRLQDWIVGSEMQKGVPPPQSSTPSHTLPGERQEDCATSLVAPLRRWCGHTLHVPTASVKLIRVAQEGRITRRVHLIWVGVYRSEDSATGVNVCVLPSFAILTLSLRSLRMNAASCLSVVAAFAVGSTPLLAQSSLPPAPAGVQTSTTYGIEFATVGAINNPSYPHLTANWTGAQYERQGRGSVSYEFRISRAEVTTGQWLEFFNTFAARSAPETITTLLGGWHNLYEGPSWWGATRISDDPNSHTSQWALRTDVAAASMIPVSGISWRTAAMYANWLHNDKNSDWSALLTGAYDTTTWGRNPNGTFTDSTTHLPGAKFWIPTLDEWTKAAFFDPNNTSPGENGWRARVNNSDGLPIPGLPAQAGATTSTGLPQPAYFNPTVNDIPLGVYEGAMSPWGLFDTSGGTSEIVSERRNDGSSVFTLGSFPGTIGDPSTAMLYLENSTRPFANGSVYFTAQGDPGVGLRIASSIPAPTTGVLVCGIIFIQHVRRFTRKIN